MIARQFVVIAQIALTGKTMPTLDELNEIKSNLLALGDEPGILAAKGETPVDIGPPETGISDDLNALFDGFADVEEEESVAEEIDSENSGIDDFEFDLEDDEPLFDMDGLDAPEDVESDDFDSGEDEFSLDDNAVSDSSVPDSSSLDDNEPELDDPDSDMDLSLDNEPLFDMDGLDSPEDVESDDFDFGEDEFSLDDNEPEIDDPDSDIDLSLDDEPAFDMDGLDSSEPKEDDFDLSGENLDFDLEDAGASDNMDGELELGEGLSLDDSDPMDLSEFEIDDSLDDDLDIDEFDLGDLGQDFGVLEDEISDVLSQELSVEETGQIEEEPEEEFEISEDEFSRVKATLQILPRNLKLIIEEQIGEKGLKGAPLRKLISALADRRSPKEIAAVTGKIIGRKIKIPSSYARKTGLDFEEEKGSFKYTLIHNILPLVKIFLVSLIILSAVGYLSFKFIYKPIYANILYNRGYKQLEDSNYSGSADFFDQAFNEYKIKKQFYRYAEGYIEADQWSYARAQYDKLLENYPFDKKGTMDYASMEFEKLADYEHSTEILNNFLSSDDNKRDQDALLLLGDIYLEWGSESYDKYDDARLAYAKIMSTYGLSNKILFRMLRYFIRTDNEKEVSILKKRFEADPELEVDPSAYAELAAYQIDKNDIGDVQKLLFRAKDVDNTLPDIHYQLARYFEKTKEWGEEDKALIKTFESLKPIHPLNRQYRQIKIDAFRRQGERFYQKEEYLQAEEDFNEGIVLLKDSRDRNIIKDKSLIYGELYADLGNIYYYISQDPGKALAIYEKAENEGYHSKEVYYNKGNIRYRNGDFRQALLEFYNSAGLFSTNSNLLYATANTLFQRNDYFAAEGYYNHLLDILEQKISSQSSIRLDERDDQRNLVESLMKAYNNMGVTLYGLFQRTGDPSKFTAAMLNFTKSNEYFDDLTRNPDSLKRTEMINLASLNQRKLLYPIPDYELQIFPDIPKYLNPR